MAGGIILDIDASDLAAKIDRLRANMTEEQFNNAMYGIFKRTGGHVRRILKDDLPKKYQIKPKDIGDAVKNPKMLNTGLGVGCCIPIAAPRRSIGGGFSASGGAHGWNNVGGPPHGKNSIKRKRRYKVKAKIIKSDQSELPEEMESYGGQPPFRNLSAQKLNKVAFTRAGKKRLPIMKVVGIAIPQMPLNRSKADVQKDIKDYLEKEIERRFKALLLNGR